MEILKINNLCKSFSSNKLETIVLDQISLNINKGDIFGVIGLSGEGKSTLVRCINRLENTDDGSILFNNGENFEDISSLKGEALRQYRKKVAMIFQDFNLLNQKNVFQNVEFPLTLNKGYKRNKDTENRIRELLSIVGLVDKENAYPSQLSGGQKQRVAIARALITNPEILLCDECTSALDPATADQILDLLKSLNKDFNLTIIIIAHQMSIIERICNKVAILSNHTIVESGDVKEIFMNPQTNIAKNLIYSEHVISRMHESKLIRLEFNGDVNSPIVANLIKDCNMMVSIVYANSWVMDDKIFGQLIIKLPYYDNDVEILKQYLDSKKINYQEVNTNELEQFTRSNN